MEHGSLENRTAPCKFCGQVNIFKWNELTPISYEQEVEEATMVCNCDSAQWYQRRQTRINEANLKIKSIFTEPEEAEGKEILLKAVPYVVDDKLKNITVKTTSGIKATLSLGSGDEPKVKIKRSVTETHEAVV